MKFQKIEGLIAAPFTPFQADGTINPELIPAYAKKLKTDNVKGVFICGTTGEGMFLTNHERKTIAEKWVKEQTEEFKVIVHVGTTSAKQSKELAEHAQKIGAYATGSLGPVFLKPSRTEELIDFCVEVASGAPELPFFYYHIPSVSGINVSMVEFLQKAPYQIPNLAGLKFTHNNFMEMQLCLELDNEKWDILHGFDEVLLAGLTFGVKAAVGSTYNYMAPLYNQIMVEFNAGNLSEARKLQAKSVKIIEILIRHNGAIVAGKSVMKSVGLDCGPCRTPLRNLSETEYSNLVKELENAGFYKLNNLT